jgi:glycosyltransferase involved in cell wall biosynthesis
MISVIVNVYNGEKYIKKCLDSIINQTYKNLEILIINDGSTDDTLKICQSYEDKRIKIINQKNIGISLSRNVGIDNATGEYLFFVDSDDYIEQDTIKYLYNTCKKHDVKMAICQSIVVNNYDKKIKNEDENVTIISGVELVKKILLNIERNGNIWGKLMHKDIIKQIRFENRIISDVAVIHKMALLLEEIAYSNQIKYYYYKHPNSILSSKSADHSIDYYKASLERYDFIKKLYPNLIENDICILLSIVNLYSHNNIKLNNFLNSENAVNKFKKMFTLKFIKSNLKRNDKIKILLFRISPKLYQFILKKYLNHKK